MPYVSLFVAVAVTAIAIGFVVLRRRIHRERVAVERDIAECAVDRAAMRLHNPH